MSIVSEAIGISVDDRIKAQKKDGRRRHLTSPAWVLFLSYVFLWVYILAGAASIMAIENRSFFRNPPPPGPPTIVYANASCGVIITGPPLPPTNPQGLPYKFWPKLTFTDSVYFMLNCLTTVGYGDIICTCPGGRGFVFVWSFFGVSGLSIMFAGLVGKLVYSGYKRVVRRVRRRLLEKGDTASVAVLEEFGPGKDLGSFGQASSSDLRTSIEGSIETKESKQQRARFKLVAILVQTVILLTAYIGWLLVGAAIFSHTEAGTETSDDGAPWTFTAAIFGAFEAATTIGFGTDYAITTQLGRKIWIVWIQIALFTQLALFAHLVTMFLKYITKTTIEKIDMVFDKVSNLRRKDPDAVSK